jgi:hypothetical protein
VACACGSLLGGGRVVLGSVGPLLDGVVPSRGDGGRERRRWWSTDGAA